MADAIFHHGEQETHIERINPGDNPAHVHGLLLGPQPNERKPYRLTAPEKHGNEMLVLPVGTVVMLHPEEAAAHHAPHGWEPEQPEVEIAIETLPIKRTKRSKK